MSRRIPFSFLFQGSIRKRLWLGGIALLLLLTTLALANSFAGANGVGRGDLGLDFSAFYTAGTFVREGRIDALYDLETIRAFQRSLAAEHGLAMGESIGPWWNPPFFAWVFVPLSKLAFPQALLSWMGINALCALLAAGLLGRVLVAEVLRTWRISGDSDDADPEPLTPRPDTSWRTWALVPLLVVVSMPFIATLTHGQNGGLSLLLLTLIVLAWRADQAMLAGLLCGLLFYKPQLAAGVAAVLVLSLGIKAALGLLCSGVGLIALTLLTLPGSLSEFLTRMPANLQQAQETLPYLWERHVTALAFWRLLIQGKAIGPATSATALLSLQCGLLLCGALVVAAVKTWKRHSPLDGLSLLDQRQLRQVHLDRLITATILGMPLIMPFYFDYDLVLLAIPATLMARESLLHQARGSAAGWSERIQFRLWTALFICLMINPHLAPLVRLNLVAVVLAAMAVTAIARACKPVRFTHLVVPAPIARQAITPVQVRRAA